MTGKKGKQKDRLYIQKDGQIINIVEIKIEG